MDRASSTNKRRVPPWKRRRRRALIIAALPLALIGGFFGWRAHLSHAINTRLAAIRAMGLPTTSEEVSALGGTVPEEENAAPLYLEAFSAFTFHFRIPSQLDAIPFFGRDETSASEPYPETTRALMAEFIDANARALSLLHEAAARPACRYIPGLDPKWQITDFVYAGRAGLPHLEKLREAAQLCCLRALLAAETGDTQETVQSLADAVALARSVRVEPLIASQTVRHQCHTDVLAALMRVLSRLNLNDGQLHALGGLLAAQEDPEAVLHAYASERVKHISWLRRGLFQGHVNGALQILGYNDLNLLAYLDASEPIMQAAALPRHEGLKARQEMERRVGVLAKRQALYVPALQSLFPLDLRLFAANDAALRTGVAALAVERYRLARGAVPDTLELLVPDYLSAGPIDPFNGEPLRYRRQDGGYLVYSVGVNGDDNGGDQKKDIVFRVAR